MRIGLVSPDLYPPQSELGKYAYEVYSALPLVGWEVGGLSGRPTSLAGAAYLRSSGHVNLSLKLSLRGSAFVASTQADLLHVVGGTHGVTLYRDLGLPVVYTIPGLEGEGRAQSPRGPTGILLRRLAIRGYRHAQMLVCPWRATYEHLLARLPVSQEHVTVVNPSVDLQTFTPDEAAREQGRLLYIERSLDGVRIALELVRYLVDQGVEVQLTLVRGPERTPLAREISEFQVGEYVDAVGPLHGDELASEYRRAELLLVGPGTEGLAMECLEAMASGLPVVGITSHVLGEAVGATGVLLPAEDMQSLGPAVKALLAEPQRRRTLGTQARERAEDLYRRETLAEGLTSVYRQALQSP